MLNEASVLKLKQSIDIAKQRISELQGRNAALLERLDTEWRCSTIEEAQDYLQELLDKKEDITKQIEQQLSFIESKYNVKD